MFYSVPVGGTTFPSVVGWLIIAALVFALYFGFVQFRKFGPAISLVKGDYSDPNDAGEVSHFQTLATALSGTVGLGNMAGIAVAVSLGGPGAVFWMILAARRAGRRQHVPSQSGVSAGHQCHGRPFVVRTHRR
ncbi:MAG: alanine:cation symporter family protein [Burkholderiales bacterium]